MNRDILEKPFGPEQIKQREGNFGKKLDYIEGHVVIQKLNDAFDAVWSFVILKHEILKETDEAIVLEAELAGVEREDIELSILGDVIIIEGRRRPVAPPGPVEFLRMERHHGRFRRLLEIPGAGDTARVRASYDNGVLRVLVPRIDERRGRRRRIEIE